MLSFAIDDEICTFGEVVGNKTRQHPPISMFEHIRSNDGKRTNSAHSAGSDANVASLLSDTHCQGTFHQPHQNLHVYNLDRSQCEFWEEILQMRNKCEAWNVEQMQGKRAVNNCGWSPWCRLDHCGLVQRENIAPVR